MKISLATPSAWQVIFLLMLRNGKSLKNPQGLWLGRVTELNKVLSTQQVCREIKTCSGILGIDAGFSLFQKDARLPNVQQNNSECIQ